MPTIDNLIVTVRELKDIPTLELVEELLKRKDTRGSYVLPGSEYHHKRGKQSLGRTIILEIHQLGDTP